MKKHRLILIADDDPDDRLMIQDAFRENNFNDVLMFFENGEDLHKYLIQAKDNQKAAKPNLILLDLNMPRMDGKTVLKKIKSNTAYQSVPVVVLSTSKANEDKKTVIRLGGEDFFTKPSSFNELVLITATIVKKWLNKDFTITKTEI